ncbi:MAG TPA: hypothetical protein VNS63_15245 [Blastocatellia bacterium]|nr:hypothetical protein [Blastocatellia bacterium]
MPTIRVVNQPNKRHGHLAFNAIRESRWVVLSVVVITLFGPALLTLQGLDARRVNASPTMTGGAVMPAALPPSEDQTVHIPYFIDQGDMTSTLTLNNNMLNASEATVTVFNSKGESFTAPTITLPSQNIELFNLRELTAAARGDFHSGSVRVSYHGPSMAVTCQVSAASAIRHVAFESVETSPMEFASSRLDSIAWARDEETRASAALTNTTTGTVTVNLNAGASVKSLTLSAHETQVIELREFLENRQGATATVIHIEHSGIPGAIIATGFALNEKTGFSCNLPFVDRAAAKTSQLAGAHVRLGRAAEKEGFPAGTRFSAPLLVANVGDAATDAHVLVDYTDGGVVNRADIAKLNLAPQEVRQVDLASELARRGIIGPVDDAGVDIKYSGEPGTVIARLTSVDKSSDFAFDVPVKDPLAEMLRVGGSYPWRLDNGYTTVLHLKNTIDKLVYALVQVRYAGGTYNLERLPLEPFQRSR